MNIRYVSSKTNDTRLTAPSLAFDSVAFAIKPQLWRRLLNINKVDYKTDVAEMVDLSIKSQTCAKGIIKAKCSHIISLFAKNLRKQTNADDIKNLVQSYLTPINYHTRILSLLHGEGFDEHLKKFQPGVNKLDNSCRMDAFFKNKDNRNPFLNINENVLKYGALQIKNGQCAYSKKDFNRIDIGHCPYNFDETAENFIFQYTSDSKILHRGNCLSTNNFYAVIQPCSKEDKNQIWKYDPEGQIVHELSRLCLIHVTDPSTKGRQIVMIQNCNNDKDGLFSKWSYLDY